MSKQGRSHADLLAEDLPDPCDGFVDRLLGRDVLGDDAVDRLGPELLPEDPPGVNP